MAELSTTWTKSSKKLPKKDWIQCQRTAFPVTCLKFPATSTSTQIYKSVARPRSFISTCESRYSAENTTISWILARAGTSSLDCCPRTETLKKGWFSKKSSRHDIKVRLERPNQDSKNLVARKTYALVLVRSKSFRKWMSSLTARTCPKTWWLCWSKIICREMKILSFRKRIKSEWLGKIKG